jgi:uncharacterized LabA/DUF88 family protein
MDQKTEKLLQNLKNKKVGVFIDGANLYHASQKYGWRVDLKRFKEFIGRYCDLQFINYYLVIPAKNDAVYYSTQGFLNKISSFVVVRNKELKYTPIGGQVIKKGNMDVEITLDIVRTIKNLDVIIVVSGDSDFLELKNYIVKENEKNILFMGYKENMAWELRLCWHLYINRIRNEVELK